MIFVSFLSDAFVTDVLLGYFRDVAFIQFRMALALFI